MKKVRFLDEPKEKEFEPIEITHTLNIRHGWKEDELNIEEGDEIIYLGHCRKDGDMFMCKSKDGYLSIWKGHLNDGVY